MFAWAANLSQEEIPEMNEETKQDLIGDLKDLDMDYPVPVNGLSNTWEFSVLPLGHLGIGNLILTAEVGAPKGQS